MQIPAIKYAANTDPKEWKINNLVYSIPSVDPNSEITELSFCIRFEAQVLRESQTLVWSDNMLIFANLEIDRGADFSFGFVHLKAMCNYCTQNSKSSF